MQLFNRYIFTAMAWIATSAFAQEAAVLRDLDGSEKVTLAKGELDQLLPNAKMGRLTARGSAQFWKNDSDGTFTISSQNGTDPRANGTAPGKWHISEDGRYCVLIEWRSVPTEEWCRYIIKAGNNYYATRSDKNGTEKVYKLTIAK